MGFILAVILQSAGMLDRTRARAVLVCLCRLDPGIQKVFADGGYAGKLITWTQAIFGWAVEVVKRNETKVRRTAQALGR